MKYTISKELADKIKHQIKEGILDVDRDKKIEKIERIQFWIDMGMPRGIW
ncbi:MAG: hypothetical protein O7D95_03110 [Betaproteobacteria bacterium]|nr:hypothetical protein [Betaproteobacteria bacterium]